MTKIIAIANEKGGVAKTTTTLSLGAALVERGQEVLLVDLDAQANLSLALGLDVSKVQHTIADVLLNSIPARSVSRETGIPGLDILPANAEMGLVERFLPVRSNYEHTLKAALRNAGGLDYDYILLDCPPFLGAITSNALTAADLLLVPTQAEYFSVHALRNLMALVRRIRQQTNPNLKYRLLITMLDRRNRIHRSLSEQLRASFGAGLFETVIETDTKLRESAAAGMPIIYYAPKSRSALQYRSLSQEITQYVQETTAQPA